MTLRTTATTTISLFVLMPTITYGEGPDISEIKIKDWIMLKIGRYLGQGERCNQKWD